MRNDACAFQMLKLRLQKPYSHTQSTKTTVDCELGLVWKKLNLGQAAQIGSRPLFRSTRTEELGLQILKHVESRLVTSCPALQPGVNSTITSSWFHCGFTLSPSDAVWNSASSCPLMRHALVTPRNQGKPG